MPQCVTRASAARPPSANWSTAPARRTGAAGALPGPHLLRIPRNPGLSACRARTSRSGLDNRQCLVLGRRNRCGDVAAVGAVGGGRHDNVVAIEVRGVLLSVELARARRWCAVPLLTSVPLSVTEKVQETPAVSSSTSKFTLMIFVVTVPCCLVLVRGRRRSFAFAPTVTSAGDLHPVRVLSMLCSRRQGRNGSEHGACCQCGKPFRRLHEQSPREG